MTTVFVSYAREDLDAAKRLANDLRQLGEEPWLDRDRLIPGQHWPSAVEKAIRDSDFFIALMSPNSVEKRGFVQKELRIALDILDQASPTQVFIIPVRLAECEPTHRPLSELQWVDLFPNWDTGIQHLRRLFEFGLRTSEPGELSGTTWAAYESPGASWTLVFEDSPIVHTFNHEMGFREIGSWRQHGKLVYAYFNQMHAQYRGTLEGDVVHGEAQNILGETWTWRGKKIL